MEYLDPKYVLKFNESAWIPKKNTKQILLLKRFVWGAVAVCLIGSFLFKDNLFWELSFYAKATLIGLFFGTLFVNARAKGPKPLEIRFYEDYLVLYRENRYYNPKMSRMEYNKFMYKDIKEIRYRPETHRINIYGVVEGKWYTYNKDGSLPQKPSYHKTTDSLSYFYTNEAPEIDFVAEFEKYTPVKVTIENN